MKNQVIIWGATGQCIVLEEILSDSSFEIVAIFDNRRIPSPFVNIPIYYGTEGFTNWIKEKNQLRQNLSFVVAIAGEKGKARVEIHHLLKQNNLQPITAIHKRAYIARSAKLGEGCQVLAMSVVCSRVTLGDCTIINTSASIDHECVIGSGCHIGPGAKLAGLVKIDDYAFIGTGAIILPRISIGSNVTIGAGSVVTRDMPDNVIAYGNPSKIIKRKE